MYKRLINQKNAVLDDRIAVLKWSANSDTFRNIGDALNPILFNHFFDRKVLNFGDILNLGLNPVYGFIGSILDNNPVRNLVVIGAGFKDSKSKVKKIPKKAFVSRGPLTRIKLKELGVDAPENFGDPAILLPKLYNPKVDKKFEIGVIPHYVDQENPSLKTILDQDDCRNINVFWDYVKFVDEIKSCNLTISSSLHGIILSHAYGVPSVWIKFGDNILGDDFKFYDYYKSVGIDISPVYFQEGISLSNLKRFQTLPDIESLRSGLINGLKNIEGFQF